MLIAFPRLSTMLLLRGKPYPIMQKYSKHSNANNFPELYEHVIWADKAQPTSSPVQF